jgi:FkbM family methyltransferase
LRDRCLQALNIRRRRRLTWQLLSATGVTAVSFERDGLVWNVKPGDEIGWELFVDGGHQPTEIEVLLEWMRRHRVLSGTRNVFVDVGANIGTTCIPIVREAGCRALAIEPVSENFSRLRQNVAANGLADRIALANNAVVRQPGTLKMRLTEGRSGGHFAARSGKAADPGVTDTCETVEADTLPAIIAAAGLSTGEIAFVWIDVQGCEPEVIESGDILWENGVPVWSEVEPRSLRIQGEPYAFADVAARYFDRFIASSDLTHLGANAVPREITELRALMDSITPAQICTDVLLLPRGFRISGRAAIAAPLA